MQTSPHFVTAVPWYGQGVWLRADFHTHTQFTDGAHPVETVVAAAASHGCDVVAITDHSDRNLNGGTPEFVDAIRAARARHPDITVITGMEWNVPPGKGNEHATILFPSSSEGADVLGRFKSRFDDQRRNDPPAEPAQIGLASLMPTGGQTLAPVVFFTHPSRIPDSPSAPRTTFEALEQDAPSILIGIEGGPGHQRGTPARGLSRRRADRSLGSARGSGGRRLGSVAATRTERLGRHRGLGFSQRRRRLLALRVRRDPGLRAGPHDRRRHSCHARRQLLRGARPHRVERGAPGASRRPAATGPGGRDGLRQRRPQGHRVAPHRCLRDRLPRPRKSDRHGGAHRDFKRRVRNRLQRCALRRRRRFRSSSPFRQAGSSCERVADATSTASRR